ncbi:ribonuclease H-like domain-containing protein [Tanacetum coccineum]
MELTLLINNLMLYVNQMDVDADASASESERSVDLEENIVNSEGDDLQDHPQECINQVKYGFEKYVNYSSLSKWNYCFVIMLNKRTKPKTYFEASEHKHWVDAMNANMYALYRNNTWELTDLLIGRKAIGFKWVFKIRYKCLINMAIESGWTLYQMDINNAFLYGDLNESIYMTLPLGYFPFNETKVFKLNKSLYGLKQAPRQWNDKLTSALIECGFVQSKKGSNNIKEMHMLPLNNVILLRETLDSTILSQKKYYLELIDEFGLLASKPSYIPMKLDISLSSEPKDDDPLLENVTDYQKLIGKGINVIKQFAYGIVLKAYSDADWARCTDTTSLAYEKFAAGVACRVKDGGLKLYNFNSLSCYNVRY